MDRNYTGRIPEKVINKLIMDVSDCSHTLSPAKLSKPLDVVVALEWQLHEDERFSARELVQRDRAIGLSLGAQPNSPRDHWLWMRDWLRQLTKKDGLLSDAQSWMNTLHKVLLGLGLLLGMLTAFATFDYDGWQRINLLVVIAVMCGLQLLLCALTLVVMLPARLTRFVPGLPSAQAFLSLLNAGQWTGFITRLLPGWQTSWKTLSQQMKRREYLYSDVKKWIFLWQAQRLALAYHAGLLLTLLLLISFQDLAFGWSSTLALETESIHRLTQWMSWPWHHLVPQAVPDLGLIDASRYFRVQGQTQALNLEEAQKLGFWWQFIVLSILFYGVFPRFVLWAICKRQLRQQCRLAIISHPEVERIVSRLSARSVSTRSLEPGETRFDKTQDLALDSLSKNRQFESLNLSTIDIVNWAQIDISDRELLKLFKQGPEISDAHASKPIAKAGGICTHAEDEQLIKTLSAGDCLHTVFALKSWEPPLAELGDFIKALLRSDIEQVSLLLVAPPGKKVTGNNYQEWARFVAALGEPALTLLSGSEE